MDIDRLLQLMVEKGASDLFITAGVPPSMKLHGKIVPVTTSPLSPEKSRETVLSTMNENSAQNLLSAKNLTLPSACAA